MQAVRNDEKNDIVHNREADVQAVQPAAIEQTDKEVKEKTNRHTEKRLLQKERDTEREKFVVPIVAVGVKLHLENLLIF